MRLVGIQQGGRGQPIYRLHGDQTGCQVLYNQRLTHKALKDAHVTLFKGHLKGTTVEPQPLATP